MGEKRYNFADSCRVFFFCVLAFLIVSLLFSFVVNEVAVLNGQQTSEVLKQPWVIFLSAFLGEAAFLVVFFAYNKWRKKSVKDIKTELDFAPQKNAKLIAFTSLLAIAMVFCSLNFTGLLNYLFSLIATENINSSAVPLDNFWQFLLSVVLCALLPAVSEELVFRGVIFGGMRQKIGTKWAVVVSALLFALIHFSIYKTIHQFVLGVVLALVFACTGSILFAIIFHFFNNLTVLLVSYIFKNGFAFEFSNWGAFEVSISIALMFVLAGLVFLFCWFAKKQNKNKLLQPSNNNEVVDQKFSALSSLLAMLFFSGGICVLIWCINAFGGGM